MAHNNHPPRKGILITGLTTQGDILKAARECGLLGPLYAYDPTVRDGDIQLEITSSHSLRKDGFIERAEALTIRASLKAEPLFHPVTFSLNIGDQPHICAEQNGTSHPLHAQLVTIKHGLISHETVKKLIHMIVLDRSKKAGCSRKAAPPRHNRHTQTVTTGLPRSAPPHPAA